MNDESAIELLPWLLNDTLDGGERERLVAYLRQRPALRDELADTVEALAVYGQHPSAEELTDLVFELPLEARAQIEEHLLACVDCADQAALVRASRAFEGEDIAPFEMPPARRWRPLAVAAGVAAVLGVGALVELNRPVVLAPTPDTDIAADLAFDWRLGGRLSADGELYRGTPQAGNLVTLAPDHQAVLLELELSIDRQGGGPWTVEIFADAPDPGGERIFSSKRDDRADEVLLLIPTEVFEIGGVYTARLYGHDGPLRREVARYSFRVAAATD